MNRQPRPTHMLHAVALLFNIVAAILGALPRAASAQLFANSGDGIREYALNGAILDASIVPGNSGGIAVAGNNLFVEYQGNVPDQPYGNDFVVEYTTGGTVVNPSLVSGFTLGGAPTTFGNYLLVPNDQPSETTIGEYNATTGATINAVFISGLQAGEYTGMAISGNNLFIVNGTTIGEYNVNTGAAVNNSLVQLPSYSIGGIAASGNNLFVSQAETGVISEYTTSGTLVNAALISGLDEPTGIAAVGSTLYVDISNGYHGNGQGMIGEFTTSGAIIDASLITYSANGEAGWSIVAIPEPSTWALLAGCAALAAALGRRLTGEFAKDGGQDAP